MCTELGGDGMRRRLLSELGMEEDEVKEWKICGEEYELAEDMLKWEFDLPDATEIFFIMLPFGTQKNSSSNSNGGITVSGDGGSFSFVNQLNGITSNSADKIWKRQVCHIILDNGMIYGARGVDTGYWDFNTVVSVDEFMFIPKQTSLSKIKHFILDGYSNYIGAGSKVKIWAR